MFISIAVIMQQYKL